MRQPSVAYSCDPICILSFNISVDFTSPAKCMTRDALKIQDLNSLGPNLNILCSSESNLQISRDLGPPPISWSYYAMICFFFGYAAKGLNPVCPLQLPRPPYRSWGLRPRPTPRTYFLHPCLKSDQRASSSRAKIAAVSLEKMKLAQASYQASSVILLPSRPCGDLLQYVAASCVVKSLLK